jgi:hypothetical protein
VRAITNLETLYEWARDYCKRSELNIWIGEDLETNNIVLVIQGLYAIIPMNGWLHDAQYIIEETISLAKQKRNL